MNVDRGIDAVPLAKPVLDTVNVGRRQDFRETRIAKLERAYDRGVLGDGSLRRTVLGEPASDPDARRRPSHELHERRQIVVARTVRSPKPTVHRALASLCKVGLAAKGGRGRYLLGDEFLRMAFANHEQRPALLWVQPILDRNPAHARGVGKMLLTLKLPVHLTSPTEPNGAVRSSALAYRTPLQALVDDFPVIQSIVEGKFDEDQL